MNQITLLGRIPSKKNSRITTRSGRSFPSKKYTDWHKDASWQLKGKQKIVTDYLELIFYFPDSRRTDLSNKTESVMDLLVDNGFIKDDCWQVIPDIRMKSGGIDKLNPRVEIYW